jgi:hypothetical protein
MVALAAAIVPATGEAAPRPAPSAQVIDGAQYAYLVPWEWRQTVTSTAGTETRVIDYPHWAVKYDGSTGILDMRSLTQRACNPSVRGCPLVGWAIALYDAPLDEPDARFITTWADNRSGVVDPLNADDAAFLLCALPEAPPNSDTLGGFVRAIFAECADPTGVVRFRPFLPNRDRVIHANLGGVRLFQERVTRGSREYLLATQALQWEYDRIVSEQGVDIALKRAGFWRDKYGEDIRTPAQIQRDGPPVDPATTQTDDFDCSDSDTTGCDLTWTEVLQDWDIASNTATKSSNSEGRARADASVSGDDHYAEVECENVSAFQWCGVVVRFNSSADTNYFYQRRNDNTSHIIYSVSSGTPTQISSCTGGDYLGTGPFDFVIRLEIDGSDLEAFHGGVSECTVTDSGITGNDMCGLYGFHAAPNFDDFTCEDLGGGGGAARRIFITQDS